MSKVMQTVAPDRLLFRAVLASFHQTAQTLAELDAIEDLTFFGYPDGRWDEVHKTPIVRRALSYPSRPGPAPSNRASTKPGEIQRRESKARFQVSTSWFRSRSGITRPLVSYQHQYPRWICRTHQELHDCPRTR